MLITRACVKEFCGTGSRPGVCYGVKVYLGQRDVLAVGGCGGVRLSKRPLQGARVCSKTKESWPYGISKQQRWYSIIIGAL
jgi:hypothetical protein